MSKSMCFLILASATLTAAAQKPKPDKPDPLTATSSLIVGSSMPQVAEWHDWLDKQNVYHSDFTDPNNEFRCSVSSYVDNRPNNPIYPDITSVTIVCSKPHKVITQ